MKLKDRVVLITGGGSGIGRAIAWRFAEEGAQIIVAGRTLSKLQETVAGLKPGRARCSALEADVSNSAAVRMMFSNIEREYRRLDVLVNNAGIGIEDFEQYNRTLEARGKEMSTGGPIRTQWRLTENMTDETWHRMISVHLDGTFFCTREALKLMGRKNSGAIINISSTAGLTGQEGAPHYSAAKAGMLGFTRALAREVGSQNIRVNALCPGFVDTPMSEVFSPAVKRGSLARIPLGRWGTADEIAAAALFLASDESSYLTGQCLSPNGGIFIG